jgi:hypothetical protein
VKDECGRVRGERPGLGIRLSRVGETTRMALSAAGRMFGRLLVFDQNLDSRYLLCSSVVIPQVYLSC